MTNKMINNKAILSGKVTEAPVYSHSVYGEAFYIFKITTLRTSGIPDIIPVMVSERTEHFNDIEPGIFFIVEGEYHSHNRHEGDRSRLLLYVFAFNIRSSDRMEDYWDDNINMLNITGSICMNPNYRETPLGRQITDLMVAVNRNHGKSDYIPCIAWGKNAMFTAGLEVGTQVEITGRIQSREYCKVLSETAVETRVAYEVSVRRIRVVRKNKTIIEL